MKSWFWRPVLIASFGMIGVAPSYAAKVPDPPIKADDSYELRLYMDTFLFEIKKTEPQIKTQIKVEKYFFVQNTLGESKGDTVNAGKTLYVASGVLHRTKKGGFSLEHTFLMWNDVNSLSFTTDSDVELDKPFFMYGSGGVVRGYTAILSKVAPSPKLDSPKAKIQGATPFTTKRP